MRMADSQRKRIGRIVRLWDFSQIQQRFCHELYLRFVRTAVPDNRLLDLKRRILVDRNRLVFGA